MTDRNNTLQIGGTFAAPAALSQRFLTAVTREVAPVPVEFIDAQSSKLLPKVRTGAPAAALVLLSIDEPALSLWVLEALTLFVVVIRANGPLAQASSLSLKALADRSFYRYQCDSAK
ncbi:hypothetical protein AB0E01_37650 [Nocardia vinacea]|uniref:hypothetical protein n=1 Tax=Nocardia vinacea TaxID=96468 RepID=UPI0033D7FF26